MSGARPIVVVGDSLLDRDLHGVVERVCPDAPVPVFDQRDVVDRPGGAALAALLAARQGGPVTLVTATADDAAGATLRGLLVAEGIGLVDLGLLGATPEKVRLRAAGQSLLRLDRGGPPGVGRRSVAEAADAIGGAAAVLVADYGRGVAASGEVRDLLQDARVPLVWDPHPKGATPVARTTVATPNLSELAGLTARADLDVAPDDDGLAATTERARAVLARWGVGAVAVTMGRRGALLVRAGGAPHAVTVPPADGGDPCGAGDCFAATTAVALAAGAVVPDAVEAGAVAAAGFVGRGGAAGLDRGPLQPRSGVAAPTAPERGRGVVVATGGCFDLLHAGHVSLLQAARALGDRLVVLLNSDRSVARLKGRDRPLQGEADRREVLLALGCVDDVVVFDEDTPAAALEDLRPDVFVKGGDYAGVDLPEAAVVERWGGQAVIVPYLRGRSTTRLVEGARRGS